MNNTIKDKEENWCDVCHVRFDCEEKEEYLKSDDTSCPYYA